MSQIICGKATTLPGPPVSNRLDQGPFGISQDQGWFTIFVTDPSREHIRNFGTGLVGYTWEENGPALGVMCGKETLEQSRQKKWRRSHSSTSCIYVAIGETFSPAPASSRSLRFGKRLSMPPSAITWAWDSGSNSPPQILSRKSSAMPDFLREKVPIVNIGGKSKEHHSNFDFYEPRYDSPEFQKAFTELNELLAERFDQIRSGIHGPDDLWILGRRPYQRLAESVSRLSNRRKNSCSHDAIADRRLETHAAGGEHRTRYQQCGQSSTAGFAIRSGCWLRSDSLIMDEPIQIEELAHRPDWLATIIEDGENRHYVLPEYADEEKACLSKLPPSMLAFVGNDNEAYPTDDYPHKIGGPIKVPYRETAGFHALDVGTNYFGLWTEADNIRRYYEKYPESLRAMEQRLGYRVRPSLIWQRKRYNTMELILGIANDGVAGVPGVLGIYAESLDGKIKVGGNLDAGEPRAGQLRQCSIILPQGMDGQQITLRAEIEVKGVRRPVRWACRQSTNPDGSLTIRLKKGSDSDWRKGV